MPPLTFHCSKDGGGFDLCASPLEITAAGVGQHTISVIATDLFGRVDPTPAIFTYTVVPAPVVDGDGDGVPDADRQLPGGREHRSGRC